MSLISVYTRKLCSVDYLLDSYPARIAYSTRQLKTGATNALRVRRSADNEELDIGFVSGGLDTEKLEAFCGTNFLKQSANFSSISWLGSTSAVISPDIVANPIDGAITADQIDFTATSLVLADLYQGGFDSNQVLTGRTFTAGIWLKGTVGETIQIKLDLSGASGSYRMVTFTGDWQFETITNTYGATTGSPFFRFGKRDLGGIGTGTANIFYAFGAQLTETAIIAPYTPTTSLRLTVPSEGFVTTWYDQAEFDKVNLWSHSGDLANGAWVKTSSTIVSNAIANPLDGLVTADKINGIRVQRNVTLTQGISYTQSVYAKAGEHTWCRLYNDGASGGAYFDLANGLLGSVSGSCTSSMQSVGGGWYRCRITFTPASTGSLQGIIFNATADNAVATLNDTNGAYYWGMQLDTSSTFRPYFATTGGARPYNVTQATQSNQPKIVSNGVVLRVSAKPTLTFDGINDTLIYNANISSFEVDLLSAFMTAQSSSLNTQVIFRNSYSALPNTGMFFDVSNHTFHSRNSSAVLVGSALVQNSNQNISSGFWRADDTVVLHRNNISGGVGVGANGVATGHTRLSLGSENGAFLFLGNLQEIILYNTDETSNRGAIETNINNYFGIF